MKTDSRWNEKLIIIIIIIIVIIFLIPVLNSPGNEKITLCNTKSTKIKLERTLLLLLLHKTVVQ